ncbi:unknown [Euproctis pseudoconspersa nucleopolyhedrovirus]|uniref:Uncharacterized protein n=1 Tax=Euproctis pseudoconspersa nucleopolyhedrovirus TaxID=307467 RepID=C3TWW8_9ABAC|nr:hypothetical protein EupsNPV_gp060 [Euproctis pseudoconspersa nucleopolyhedrovirus]ACO53510.1 unknown [Euproctis pseudoconspersa nucleopolyhedrovirus]QUJ09250.1 hypothetical protein Gyru_ORF55 [Gynaephora ruoergensis nucleopolyhedrovirus]
MKYVDGPDNCYHNRVPLKPTTLHDHNLSQEDYDRIVNVQFLMCKEIMFESSDEEKEEIKIVKTIKSTTPVKKMNKFRRLKSTRNYKENKKINFNII